MALNQVKARSEGDIYQGLFFWREASLLLREGAMVEHVTFEDDSASGVDDISVTYMSPGVADSGIMIEADYYQVKYHVDNRDVYSSDAMIDPAFINAKTSLLQRFYTAYKRLSHVHSNFRLNLVSNWQWATDDSIADIIRETDGSLPEQFFIAGPRTALGANREKWKLHLQIGDGEFNDFARKLRFGLNQFGRRGFTEAVHDRLSSLGLKVPAANTNNDPYIGIYISLLIGGTNTFDKESFRDLCKRNDLIREASLTKDSVIGIRSFMRFAERIEDETDRHICVSEHFDGRHVKDSSLWGSEIAPSVVAFLNNPAFRKGEHSIFLDCHNSLAFLAGYELDQKSGANMYPVQKGLQTQKWKPDGQVCSEKWGVESEITILDEKLDNNAFAISITHDILSDVTEYLRATGLMVGKLVHVKPSSGCGPACIKCADQAIYLAEKTMGVIRNNQSNLSHIFTSAPNGFMFYLGKYRDAFGKLQLYEYDFTDERDGTYTPSIGLPFTNDRPGG